MDRRSCGGNSWQTGRVGNSILCRIRYKRAENTADVCHFFDIKHYQQTLLMPRFRRASITQRVTAFRCAFAAEAQRAVCIPSAARDRAFGKCV